MSQGTTITSPKPFLDVLSGKRPEQTPFWYMRQAGRYLSEYRAVREKAGGFLDLCYTPDLAAEVTLQPIRFFGTSAAILFSDILVIPDGLGQKVWFEQGHGPRLEPVRTLDELKQLSVDRVLEHLAPVMETVSILSRELPSDVALIGFAGAPWTVATYMVQGAGSSDQAMAKRWAYSDPDGFSQLIDMVTEATIAYLQAQIDAGAEAVQIFDSWAGGLPESAFATWCIGPAKRIREALAKSHPGIPVIGFPRACGPLYPRYFRETGVDCVSMDQGMSSVWAAQNIQPIGPVQGNLDPQLVCAGGSAMREAAIAILEAFADGPHVFNLGHGFVPDTPREHVAELSELVRNWRA